MDSQQDFLRPAPHPFYVKKPIVLDSKHAKLINNHGFQNNSGKPSAYSVDLSWYGYGKRHGDQLSEPAIPYPKNQSLSLRDVFEKAILSGGVPIDSTTADDDNGPHRNPSFITSSLPRQPKAQKGASPPSRLHPSQQGSTDYFLDSSSESETESNGGRHNDAYVDDVSSTLSDEMFKSASEEPRPISPDDDHPHIRPLPLVLDVSDNVQASRSALSGLFKPKFKQKDGSAQGNNVHRNPVWDHNEVMGSTRRTTQPNSLSGRLPRTPYPLTESAEVDSRTPDSYRNSWSPGRDEPEDRISHNKYLPSRVRSSRRSPRLSRTSPRLHRSRQYYQEDEDNLDEIRPASPIEPHQSRLVGDGAIEQMQMEDPPWVKEHIRRARKRRRCRIITLITVLVAFAIIGGLVGFIFGYLLPTELNKNNLPTISDSSSTSPTSIPTLNPKPAPTSENITLAGVMRITSLNFTAKLEEPDSPEFTNLSGQFCSAMDSVFNQVNTTNRTGQYQGCRVNRFSEGSIKTYYELDFTLSISADDPKEASTELLMNRTITAIKRSVEDGGFQPRIGHEWVVDSANLTLEVQTGTTGEINSTTIMTSTINEFPVNNTVIDGNGTSTGEPATESGISNATAVTPTTTTESTNTTVVAVISTTTTASITTTTITMTTTASITTTTPSITTTQQRTGSGCSEGMIEGKTYIHPLNCTKYRTCITYNSSSYKEVTIPCQKYKMYRQNSEHTGTCEVCDPEVCDQCEALPELDDSENKTATLPMNLPTTELANHHSLPRQTITSVTITPNSSQSNRQLSTINPPETTNPSAAMILTNITTILNNLPSSTVETSLTASHTASAESALCNTLQPNTSKTIPVDNDCTKFAFCFNNSTYAVVTECQCEQMFDPDESKCVACNFVVCGDCKICNF